MFLTSVGSEILTARFDAEGEKQIAVVTIKNTDTLKKSLSPEFKKSENQNGAEIWKVEDEDLTAAFIGNNLIVGDSESVLKCLQAKQTGENFTKSKYFQNLFESRAAVATYGKTDDSAHKIAELLGNVKNKELRTNSYYLTETRFEATSFVRKTVFGFWFDRNDFRIFYRKLNISKLIN